jgi:hypothetical protein
MAVAMACFDSHRIQAVEPWLLIGGLDRFQRFRLVRLQLSEPERLMLSLADFFCLRVQRTNRTQVNAAFKR